MKKGHHLRYILIMEIRGFRISGKRDRRCGGRINQIVHSRGAVTVEIEGSDAMEITIIVHSRCIEHCNLRHTVEI